MQWWLEAGVDVMVDEAPRDWLRPEPKAPPPPAPAPSEAREERLPDQLDLFQAWLRDSGTLPFASPSAPRVCPSGDPASGLMIMVDMPATEDRRDGALLSGEAGRLFDRMMAAIGRDRGSLYLAALSCFRSPDGRFTSETGRQCATIARHHIGLAAPKALLLFGDACSKALLGLPMAKARGRWHEVATHAGPVKTLVTIPPSYLLDQPSAKALAWADLQMLAEGLKP
ncbi:uracil-DNA glycosylase [Sphingosinicella humi]|uniref:Uracil-DNA glycosylase n=1 Tax=Allosphingosinicella humi TaxID=2068657 RepID=A0A2U2IZ29_9SPHN|nr:uracil-DNA glycosylase [Sphingosinicella humi]PWG01345.1 uracil-DNA glycosylase [Sphingosinicella humi]